MLHSEGLTWTSISQEPLPRRTQTMTTSTKHYTDDETPTPTSVVTFVSSLNLGLTYATNDGVYKIRKPATTLDIEYIQESLARMASERG